MNSEFIKSVLLLINFSMNIFAVNQWREKNDDDNNNSENERM